MNIVLIGVNGALNSGDQELCAGTIRLIQEAFPGATLSGVHRNPDLQARHFPEVRWLLQIGASYSERMIRRRIENLGGLGAATINASLRRNKAVGLSGRSSQSYRALATADLIVGCAGGWLEDHYVSIWTNLIHLTIAASNRVPIVFAPQSIGPFDKSATRRLAKWVFERSAGIAAREGISHRYALGMGVSHERLKLFPDLALFATDVDLDGADTLLMKLSSGKPPRMAGTTLMPWSFPGSSDPHTEMTRYLDKVEEVIRELHQRTGLKTLLLRQIRDDKGYRGDGHLIEEMAQRVPEATVCSPDYLEPQLLRGMIARCEVFWGSRMHSNIFAASQRVPVVTVAYQHKAEGIMQMLGLGEYVVWIDSFEPSHLCSLIEKALSEKNDLQRTLDQSFQSIMPQWEALRNFVREAVSVRSKIS